MDDPFIVLMTTDIEFFGIIALYYIYNFTRIGSIVGGVGIAQASIKLNRNPSHATSMSTLHDRPQQPRSFVSDAAAKSMLSSINDILSRPLVITVKCEKEECASILNVEIPHSLEAAAPPRLVVRCAACASLLRVDLPETTYVSHKTAQLEMLRACQQYYNAQRDFQSSSLDANVGTPEQRLATSRTLDSA